jgi:hypothetical protein
MNWWWISSLLWNAGSKSPQHDQYSEYILEEKPMGRILTKILPVQT